MMDGLGRGFKWHDGLTLKPPNFLYYQWKHLTVDVEVEGPLAEDFASGSKKLIPIMFSHGMLASRCAYTVTNRELASNGYIVFVMD